MYLIIPCPLYRGVSHSIVVEGVLLEVKLRLAGGEGSPVRDMYRDNMYIIIESVESIRSLQSVVWFLVSVFL